MGVYVLSPLARDDVESIGRYVRDAAGDEVAQAVLFRIQEQCQQLADLTGQLGRPRDDIRPGIRSKPVSPHVLFFRYIDEGVQIVRVLHERQDIGQHFQDE